MQKTPEKVEEQILELLKAGMTQKAVREKFGVGHAVIRRLVEENGILRSDEELERHKKLRIPQHLLDEWDELQGGFADEFGGLSEMSKELIIDCFAGGGGASVGIEMALGRPVDIAINHDPDAILMHKTNHPNTLHLTEDIFKVNMRKYVKDQHVALMWASPDCTSHSKAKGGKPRERGLRILPWAVYKHAKEIL